LREALSAIGGFGDKACFIAAMAASGRVQLQIALIFGSGAGPMPTVPDIRAFLAQEPKSGKPMACMLRREDGLPDNAGPAFTLPGDGS